MVVVVSGDAVVAGATVVDVVVVDVVEVDVVEVDVVEVSVGPGVDCSSVVHAANSMANAATAASQRVRGSG